MAYSDNFPATRPVFMADFANGGKIDPRASFTRASTANVFDGAKHESSQNLVLQSQDLDTTWTVFTGTPAVTGGQTAPNGTSTAWAVTAQTASSAISQVQQSVSSVGASKTYTLSAYLKAGTASHTYMTLRGSGSVYGFVEIDWADPLNPRVATRTFTSASATVTAVGSGGWYRVALTTTTDASTSSGLVYIGPSDGTTQNANGYPVWNSSGETAIAWGVQLEERGSATVYNATTTQIHREYASSLVSKANNIGRFEVGTDGQSAGTSLGILVEGQATNLQRYGSSASNWSDASTVAVTSGAGVSPSGTLTADLLVSPASAGSHYVLDTSIAFAAGTTYTASIYVKSAGHQYIQLCGNSGAFGSGKFANFDLVNGTTSATNATSTIDAVGNGYYRISFTAEASVTATSSVIVMFADSLSDGFFPTTTGDAYSGFLVWGYQIETGSYASSLVDTGTGSSQLTRAADSMSVATADIGYTGGDGSLFIDLTINARSSGMGAFLSSDADNYYMLGQFASTLDYALYSELNGSVQINQNESSTAIGSKKLAASWSTNNASSCINGGTVATDTSNALPLITDLHIGSNQAGAAVLNGHVKRVAIFSEALSDQNLISLTS